MFDQEKMARSFPVGGMWEFAEWKIDFDVEIEQWRRIIPCKHCSPIETRYNTSSVGPMWSVDVFTCPRVVIAENEGGCNSTGICLDCILEATKGIDADQP